MQRSTGRILTTHVGSLPRPEDLVPILQAKDNGREYDHELYARRVSESVQGVVAKQAGIGVDVINDGEHSKASFTSYHRTRLTGFETTDKVFGSRAGMRDALAFPAVYADLKAMYACRPSVRLLQQRRDAVVCTGPITYVGQAEVEADVANLQEALRQTSAEEGFMTALAPTNVAQPEQNEHYRTDEEFFAAIADAMHQEYRVIVDAGLVLQIDDPRLATYWDRNPGISIEECRKAIAAQIEILNYALRGIPEDRVRYHTCYSVNIGPRTHDLELKHFADLLLTINAGAYSFEASNPRHEHEWQVWQDVQLPEHKTILPGVVSHCVYLVEHPELVAQRIERFASVVGKERVVASNDCGFATAADGDQVHPDVAWAKLTALVEGARLASARLFG
jgi:5-methyltetrahydropteroyltriglutamate--homocysteine methyltransferase